MKVTSLIFLAASATVVAASDEFKPKVKLINRRDAMPIPGVFMNAVQAVPALRKRDLGKPLELAEVPGKVQKRSLLETRQWGCETVGQINCSFEGCCNQGTVCGTYGGQTGCCPIGKTCTGVGSCKSTETACGNGCCPSNASCTTNAGGSAACDYGLSGSSSSMGTSKPTATSSRSLSSPTPSGSSSGGTCPNNYSPCPGTDSCCPAGVKCLPDKKCDATCSATDVRCGTGCCKDGFTCDTSTSICQEGSGSTNNDDSDSGTTLLPKSTTAAGSGSGSKTDSLDSGSTTLGGSTAQTGVAAGGNGGSGSSGSSSGITPSGAGSSGPRLIFGMGVAGIVAVVGVALL